MMALKVWRTWLTTTYKRRWITPCAREKFLWMACNGWSLLSSNRTWKRCTFKWAIGGLTVSRSHSNSNERTCCYILFAGLTKFRRDVWSGPHFIFFNIFFWSKTDKSCAFPEQSGSETDKFCPFFKKSSRDFDDDKCPETCWCCLNQFFHWHPLNFCEN